MSGFDPLDNESLWGLTVTDPTEPADPIDHLVSELLDIQDDIAQAVTWIAEHWSAHLPSINWASAGPGGRGALILTATAPTQAVLDHIAALLDGDVVVEVHGDLGLTHHCWHRFGRVLFHASHTEAHAPRVSAA